MGKEGIVAVFLGLRMEPSFEDGTFANLSCREACNRIKLK
jgi:hypothetical protein